MQRHCPLCGDRFVTEQFLERHLLRACRGETRGPWRLAA
jgi:hypothetical protein